MADVDDELLALAGGDSSDEANQSPDEQPKKSSSSRPKPKPVSSSSKKRSSSTSKGKGSASKKQKRDRIDSDEDQDEDEHDKRDDEDEQEEEEEDDDEGDDDDDDPETLYPVDGIYKSAQEREDFLDMPEFEREEILAQRRDELNSLKQASELRRMVAAQKAGSRSKGGKRGRGRGSDDDEDSDYGGGASKSKGRTIKKSGTAANAAKNRKRSAPGNNSTKSAKLQELKKRREEKAKKVAKVNQNRRDDDDDDDDDEEDQSSSDSDEDEGESSDFRDEDDEPVSKRKGRNFNSTSGGKDSSKDTSHEPPTLMALNKARLTRELVEKIMYRPGWTSAMRGLYIRYCWKEIGPDKRPVDKYRIHEILGTREGKRHYDVSDGRFTKVLVEVEFANRRQELVMSGISNQDFDQDERQRWILVQQSQTGRSRTGKTLTPTYPSNQSLFEQGEGLREYLQKPLNDSDVSKMLSAKKEARLAFEEEKRNHYNKLGRGGGDGGGGNGNGEIDYNGRDGFNGSSRSGGATNAEKAMAELNAKHRNEDRVRIYEAEKKSAMAKRAAMGLNVGNNQNRNNNNNNNNNNGSSNNSPGLSGSSSSNGLKMDSQSLNSNTAAPAPGARNEEKVPGPPSDSKTGKSKSQFPALNAAQSIDVDLGDF